MKEQLNLSRQVFDKEKFTQTVDTTFNELVEKPNPTFFDIDLATINDFFILYEKFFYEIPKEGETNSHSYLVKQSSDYLNLSQDNENVRILLEEINLLREENLKLNEENLKLATK